MIRVAVRDEKGVAHLFRLLPEHASTHEEAVVVVKADFPEAKVILSSVAR